MDIGLFLSSEKSLVIAPAGYGKTHTIAEAVEAYHGKKKILVLTHTHAGIASLREKFENSSVPASKYQLDTISSFALNLTKIYHINKAEIPSEEQSHELFQFAIEHASQILKAKPIRTLMSAKYEHLIVDEYQDCTVSQHQMIMVLAEFIKSHLLGDPLQGIFGFRNTLVDFNDITLAQFAENRQHLNTPWRWNNANRIDLGRDLDIIRSKLLRNEDIKLDSYDSIETLIASEADYTRPRSEYRQKIYEVTQDENVLLVHPRSENPVARVRFIQQFPQFRMIESIDDKKYYEYCDTFDRLNGKELIVAVVEMMRACAKATVINAWFNSNCNLIRKRSVEELEIRGKLESIIESIVSSKSYAKIAILIEAIKKLPDVRIYRKEFVRDICNTLRDAEQLGITARASIERNRNILRRTGRKINGKCIGTTLLTKGLEFDTVVILNAHHFKSPKHLYVALTRCCRRLVVITNTPILHPYN